MILAVQVECVKVEAVCLVLLVPLRFQLLPAVLLRRLSSNGLQSNKSRCAMTDRDDNNADMFCDCVLGQDSSTLPVTLLERACSSQKCYERELFVPIGVRKRPELKLLGSFRPAATTVTTSYQPLLPPYSVHGRVSVSILVKRPVKALDPLSNVLMH